MRLHQGEEASKPHPLCAEDVVAPVLNSGKGICNTYSDATLGGRRLKTGKEHGTLFVVL